MLGTINWRAIFVFLLATLTLGRAYFALFGGNIRSASGSDATHSLLVPDAHYDMKEGDAYGYQVALSKNDQDSGKSAHDIIMYRFLGEDRGIYTLVGGNGDNIEELSCAKPCQSIKRWDPADEANSTEYLAYDPDSVMGGAMEDALNGKLEVSHTAPADVAKAKLMRER